MNACRATRTPLILHSTLFVYNVIKIIPADKFQSKIKEDIGTYREESQQYEMEIQSVHNTALQKMRNLHLNPTNGSNTLIRGFIYLVFTNLMECIYFCTFIEFSELSY